MNLLNLSTCSTVSSLNGDPGSTQRISTTCTGPVLTEFAPNGALATDTSHCIWELVLTDLLSICICIWHLWRCLCWTRLWNTFKYLGTNNHFPIWVSMQAHIAIIPHLHKGTSLCCWLRYTQVCVCIYMYKSRLGIFLKIGKIICFWISVSAFCGGTICSCGVFRIT